MAARWPRIAEAWSRHTGRPTGRRRPSTRSWSSSRRHRLDLSARDVREAPPVLMSMVAVCSSSRAPTSRACCSPARRRGRKRLPSAGHWRPPRPHRPPASRRERAAPFAGAACGVGLAAMTGRFLLDRLSTGPAAVELDPRRTGMSWRSPPVSPSRQPSCSASRRLSRPRAWSGLGLEGGGEDTRRARGFCPGW